MKVTDNRKSSNQNASDAKFTALIHYYILVFTFRKANLFHSRSSALPRLYLYPTNAEVGAKIWSFSTATNIYTWRACQTNKKTKQTLWPESESELYRLSDHRLSAKLVPTFAERGVTRGQRDGSLWPYSRFSRPRGESVT
jgi:hypothetical protein